MEEGSADWHTPSPAAFATERELQRLIADSPSLLPGVDEPTAVAKEVRASGAGRADVVVVDAQGEITIVECKLFKNPEMHRWVIGQVFSYAAALWKLDYKDFERAFAARGTALTKSFKDVPGWHEATFCDTVSQNLADGAFRLIIAGDEITEKLKRTVVFLNSHTRPEVSFLALELRNVSDEGIQSPVPDVYGENSAEIGPLRPTWPPDRVSLVEGIHSANAVRVAENLLDWAESKQPRVSVSYGLKASATDGVIKTPAGALFSIKGHRHVRVSLSALAAHWDENRIKRLIEDLAKIDTRFNIDTRSKRNRPTAPLESLTDEGKREKFLALMEQNLKTLTG